MRRGAMLNGDDAVPGSDGDFKVEDVSQEDSGSPS